MKADRISAPPRLLVFSSLYPSAARLRHGIFVETRLRQLLRAAPYDVRVIAPVPWFPFTGDRFGEYAQWARTPRVETRHGIDVWHPRYPMLPKIGMRLQPIAMRRAALATLDQFARTGWRPQLIAAHYFYPDGVAAAAIAARMQVPLVITAHGSDINLIAQMPGRRHAIVRAAARATAVVTVSEPLRRRCIALGAAADKVVALRNGVDTELFAPRERAQAQRALGLPEARWLCAVGNLVPEKGFDLALQALARLEDARLLIVGDGPQRDFLRQTAARLGVAGRVEWRAAMPQSSLADVYSACDALLLTSLREGWPNVVLESLACGTPVVATDVGAVSEMLTLPAVGAVVATRNPGHFADAVQRTLQRARRADCRAHAERFGWAPVAASLAALFERAMASSPAEPGVLRAKEVVLQ